MPFTFKLSKRLALMKALVPAAEGALATRQLQDRRGVSGSTPLSTLRGAGHHVPPHHDARTLADSAARRFSPDQRCRHRCLERQGRHQLLGRPAYRSYLRREVSAEPHAPQLSARSDTGAPPARRSVVRVRSSPLITPCLGDGLPVGLRMWVDSLMVATSQP